MHIASLPLKLIPRSSQDDVVNVVIWLDNGVSGPHVTLDLVQNPGFAKNAAQQLFTEVRSSRHLICSRSAGQNNSSNSNSYSPETVITVGSGLVELLSLRLQVR